MRAERVLACIAVALGAVMIWKGWKLGYWVPVTGPGPGFFPLLVGVGWLILAVLVAPGSGGSAHRLTRQKFSSVLTGWGVFAGATALSPHIGMIPALFLLLLFWLRRFGQYGWLTSVVVASVTAAGVYLVFGLWLAVPLPRGPLGW